MSEEKDQNTNVAALCCRLINRIQKSKLHDLWLLGLHIARMIFSDTRGFDAILSPKRFIWLFSFCFTSVLCTSCHVGGPYITVGLYLLITRIWFHSRAPDNRQTRTLRPTATRPDEPCASPLPASFGPRPANPSLTRDEGHRRESSSCGRLYGLLGVLDEHSLGGEPLACRRPFAGKRFSLFCCFPKAPFSPSSVPGTPSAGLKDSLKRISHRLCAGRCQQYYWADAMGSHHGHITHVLTSRKGHGVSKVSRQVLRELCKTPHLQGNSRRITALQNQPFPNYTLDFRSTCSKHTSAASQRTTTSHSPCTLSQAPTHDRNEMYFSHEDLRQNKPFPM